MVLYTRSYLPVSYMGGAKLYVLHSTAKLQVELDRQKRLIGREACALM